MLEVKEKEMPIMTKNKRSLWATETISVGLNNCIGISEYIQTSRLGIAAV